MTYFKQTIHNYKNVSAKYETRTAVLKALRAGRKPQETERFLISSAQVAGLPFEESFGPKPEC
jgi:hypothetical protein